MPGRAGKSRRAVVVLNGPLAGDSQVLAAIANADLVVAADGGAGRLVGLGRQPDLVVGDLDSLDPSTAKRLRAAGVRFEQHPRAKDLTDGELALLAAIERGAESVTVLGALGGERPDMVFANLMLLCHRRADGLSIHALADGWAIWPVGPAELVVDCRPGQTISLVPLDATVTGVDLGGTRWELAGAQLASREGRGLSNVCLTDRVTARAGNGRLLLFHQYGSGPRDGRPGQ